MRRFHSLVLLLHLAVAITIVVTAWKHLQHRRGEVAALARVAAEERAATHREEAATNAVASQVTGFAETDPYVVELLARERFGFRSIGVEELPPPPLPDIDSVPAPLSSPPR